MMHLLAQAAGPAAASPMHEKLGQTVPEIILFGAAVLVMVVGLSPRQGVRELCGWIAGLALVAAGIQAVVWPAAPSASPLPAMMPMAKAMIAAIGVLLVMLNAGIADREYEAEIARGGRFDGIRSVRAEFYAFMLFSLMGLMLCTTADDLIWLFLALELTSLPTYVMVSISTRRTRSQEAGVKYFFLGALGAAVFLYGFTMLYGATGTTQLFGPAGISGVLAANMEATGSIGALGTLGIVLSIVGISFKIAAVPMHFYAADVYEGAATPVSAFLAFVPKAAGFFTLILLVSAVGWWGLGVDGLPAPNGDGPLPEAVRITLWVMAALTMTVGNVLAILQRNVKRILAYSSVAHSGYMLVGLIAGPGMTGDAAGGNGLAATLFYLFVYGIATVGAFAVLGCLERRDAMGIEEAADIDDLRGLCSTRPLLGWVMVLSAASLLGIPPILGFWGKLYLFTSGIAAGEIALVIVLGVNSAIAAFYYLRLIYVPLLESADDHARSIRRTPFGSRVFTAGLAGTLTVALVGVVGWLMDASDRAMTFERSPAAESAESDAAAAPGPRAEAPPG